MLRTLLVGAWGVMLVVLLGGCGLFAEAVAEDVLGSESLDGRCGPGADLPGIVWLDVGVTGEQVAEIDRLLASLPAVAEHRHVDLAESVAEFRASWADNEEVLDLVSPEQIPTSFEIVLAGEADRDEAIAAIERAPGVDDVETLPPTERCPPTPEQLEAACRTPLELIVWLQVGVDDQRVAAVEALLAASSIVATVHYVDAEETYADFQEYYADEPGVLDLVEPGALPTSFRVTSAEAGAGTGAVVELERLAAELVALPGVDEVEGVAEAWALVDSCGEAGLVDS